MKLKIPNILTIGRIIIVPIFVLTFFIPGFFADEFLGTGYVIYVLTFAIFAFYCSQKPTNGKNRFGVKPKK